MTTTSARSQSSSQSSPSSPFPLLSQPSWLRLLQIFAQPRYDALFIVALLLLESTLCALVIRFIRYTEIDWRAYMQEVEGWWVDGETNYFLLRGDTGPLVYPAGFLYLFLALRYATDGGTNILRAQCIFAGLYVIQLIVVLLIYQRVFLHKEKRRSSLDYKYVWSCRIAMGLLCLSKRLHSIFVLRLFNDGIAMLCLYVAIYLYARNYWHWGCVWFSVAVSIKMNVLLFAPGLLLLLLQGHASLYGTIMSLSICAGIQLLLGAPFLLTYPEAYLRKAFELDRVFFYKWTVNWKFLSEETFLSKPLAILLVALHLGALVFFALQWLKPIKLFLGKPLSPAYICYTLLLSNFCGIVFARTLHYQFYAWYYHAIPLLLWVSPTYPVVVRLALWMVLEYAFNVFPATPLSSALLQVAHGMILLGCQSPSSLGMTIIQDDDDENDKKISVGSKTASTTKKAN